MRLTDFKSFNLDIDIYRDAEFESFAQCIVQLKSKTLTFLEDKKFLDEITQNRCISAVICRQKDIDLVPKDLGIIISTEPKYIFFKLYNLVKIKNTVSHKNSTFGNNVIIGQNVSISEFDVTIGNNVTIGDNVVIKNNTIIEDDVIISSGSVIGDEGFEVKRRSDCSLFLVKHYGSTIIRKNTVLKSLVSIHKAVFEWDATEIGENCVIDSMVHIAHGSKLGKYILLGANSTICGNCIIENGVYIGPNACISNRTTIKTNARISLGSVVTKNVEENAVVTGNFAINHEKWISFIKSIDKII